MRLFITGITGFVGEAARRELQGRGHGLWALVRSEEAAAALRAKDVIPVLGALEDPKSYESALREVEGVVHLAAEIATQRDPKKIWDTNVDGTRALLDAASDKGHAVFLFVSTVVTGDGGGRTLDEMTEFGARTTYGISKREGERLVLRATKAGRVQGVILRPSHVYGPGGWYADVVRDMKRGLFRIPGKGDNWWDMVHVDDVAQAIRLCVETPAPGEIFHVVDDEPVTMNDFIGRTAAALGRKKPGHAPIWLASLVKGADPIRAAVRSAKGSNQKIKTLLKFSPKYPSCEEGILVSIREMGGAS